MKLTLRTSRQFRRLSFATVILLAVSSVAIISAPSLRVLAQEIFNYFTRTRNDQVNVDIRPGVDESKLPPNSAAEWRKIEMEARETATVAQMESQRGFNLKEPTVVPAGLVLKQVFSPYPEIVALAYDNSQNKTGFLVVQQHLNQGEPMVGAVVQLLPADKNHTNGSDRGAFAITFSKKPLSKDEPAFRKRGSTPVGASAKAQIVQIGDYTGEYLKGIWEQSEEGRLRWVNNTEFRQIQWREGDVLFQILTPKGMSKDELVAIARSMK